jgi:hypothetical protein
MTIQRQYSLPNCRLVLEGWGEENAASSSNFMSGRPVMTILTNAECHFTGQEKPISGDREFLEHLIVSVNHYAQEVLSGISHQQALGNGKAPSIRLSHGDHSFHSLTIKQASSDASKEANHASGDPVQLKLSTVQLFDLVEAIDQMIADAQTLPDLYLDLTPVPKRGAASQEPVAKRVIPAALGVSSLAIAAGALFFIPVPEFEITEPDIQPTEELSDGLSATPGTEPDPLPDSSETSSESEPNAAGSDPSGTASEVDGEPPSQEEIEELFVAATPIADSEQLDELTSALREQIVDAWSQTPTFEDDLEYRVGVSSDGQILGYKYENDAALTYADEIPLGELTAFPLLEEEVRADAPIAQFRVVFRPSRVVEVSPWYGRILDDDDS